MWYRPAFKINGFKYYDYMLCYVNDIICISHDSGIALGPIQAVFKIKGDKMDQPKIYLWDKVGKMIVDGVEGWYMSA